MGIVGTRGGIGYFHVVSIMYDYRIVLLLYEKRGNLPRILYGFVLAEAVEVDSLSRRPVSLQRKCDLSVSP